MTSATPRVLVQHQSCSKSRAPERGLDRVHPTGEEGSNPVNPRNRLFHPGEPVQVHDSGACTTVGVRSKLAMAVNAWCGYRGSSHESTLGRERARVHVATAVQMVIDLGRTSEHARVEEDRAGGS